MRRTAGIAVLATAAVWLVPGGATAHEGHDSCRAAGQFAAGQAQQFGSGFGQAAAGLAQQGQADDFVASVHAALCASRP